MSTQAHVQGARRTGSGLFNQPYLLLSLTSLFWAGNMVLGRFVAGHIPPMTLAFIRWGGASVVLLPFAARHLKQDWPVIRKHAGLLTLLALSGFSAYNALTYYGLQYTTAINGLLLQSIGPLFVAMWTLVLYRERLTLRQSAGLCVSLIGVVIIVCRGNLGTLRAVGLNPGDIWFLVALAIYGFYTAALRKRPPMQPISFLAVGMTWGALLLVPAMVVELAGRPAISLDHESLLSFAYVCLFPSLLGYLFLNRGIELIGANRAAPFLYLVPVFGSVLAITLLGERFEWYHAGGYTLVLAGIALTTRR